MGSINLRNGKFVADFRYMNQRCREQTQLSNTSAKRLTCLLKTIEAEILLGNFQYPKYFLNSKKVQLFDDLNERKKLHHNNSTVLMHQQ